MFQRGLLLKHTYGEDSTLNKYFLHMTQIEGAHGAGKPPKIISPPIGSCKLLQKACLIEISAFLWTGIFLELSLTSLLDKGMSGHI